MNAQRPTRAAAPAIEMSRTMASLSALGALAWLLVRAGEVLVPPRQLARSAIVEWAQQYGLLHAGMSVARVVALVLVGHLAVVALLSLAAACSRMPVLVQTSRLVTPRAWRPLVGPLLGIGLTLASAGAAPVGALSTQSRPAVMQVLDQAEPTTAEPIGGELEPDRSPPVMVATAKGSPSHTTQPAGSGAVADLSPDPGTTPEIWVIEPGDHLWGVSRHVLHQSWARVPTDAEVAAYLDRLVVRNRQSLAVPDDPDLIFAGQVFVLPEPPRPES